MGLKSQFRVFSSGLLLWGLILQGVVVFSQQNILVSKGATFYVGTNTVLHMNGSAHFTDSSVFTNKGDVFLSDYSVMFGAVGHCIMDSLTVVSGSGNYTLDGDWENSAAFNSNTSHVYFSGANQVIKGDSVSDFYNITLQGSGIKSLAIDARCSNVLDLKDRELHTDTNIFWVDNLATSAIQRTAGFVSSDSGGFLSRNFDNTIGQSYEFPVGSSVGVYRYRPVSITTTVNDYNTMQVRMANLDAGLEGYDRGLKDSTLCTINPDFYHQIRRELGLANAVDVSIYFDQALDIAPSTIAQWQSGGLWSDIGPATMATMASPALSNATRLSWGDFNEIAFALATEGIEAGDGALTASCNGVSDGIAYVNPLGGTTPYVIAWVNPLSANDSISGLSSGYYAYNITDTLGCSITDSVFVDQPDSLLSMDSIVNVTCNGGSSGVAYIVPTGGTAPYTYQWDANAGGGIADSATGLSQGSYWVTVMDGNFCVDTHQVVVNQPGGINGLGSGVMPQCNGESTGQATVILVGGTPPYSYQWGANAGGQTTGVATGLSAGLYSVTATDSLGCTKILNINISQPSLLLASSGIADTAGCVSTDGSAYVASSGGTGGHGYQWSDGLSQTGDTAYNLLGGWYYVTVTDANNCEAIDSVNIPIDYTKGGPDIAFSITNPTCNGFSDGIAIATPQTGTAPFSYQWSNPDTDSINDPISAGTYFLTVVDVNGCLGYDTAVLIDKPPLSASINGDTAACTGSVVNLIATGNGATEFVWNTGDTLAVISPLATSDLTYVVTVSDGVCEDVDSTSIRLYALPSVSIIGDDAICENATATLSAVSTGSTYLWNTGDSTVSIEVDGDNPLPSYTVTVTDIMGCDNSTDAAPFDLTVISKPVAVYDTLSRGVFKDIVYFIDSSYSDINNWAWDFGDGVQSNQQNPKHEYQDIGLYDVTLIVENAYGCLDTVQGQIEILEDILIPNVFSPNGDGYNDYFTVPVTGNFTYELVVYNRWGQELFRSLSDRVEWDGRTASGKPANEGTYYYLLTAVGSTDYSQQGSFNLLR